MTPKSSEENSTNWLSSQSKILHFLHVEASTWFTFFKSSLETELKYSFTNIQIKLPFCKDLHVLACLLVVSAILLNIISDGKEMPFIR